MSETLVFAKKEKTEVRGSPPPAPINAVVGFLWILGLTAFWMGLFYSFYKVTDYLLGR